MAFASGIANIVNSGSTPRAVSGGTNPKVFGSGVSVDSVSTSFAQGTLRQIGEASNLALQGPGMFVVSPDSSVTKNSRNEFIYTRDGTFNIDADGNLVNTSGQFVMGLMFYNETTSEMKSINNPNYTSVTYLSDQNIGSGINPSTNPAITASGIGFPGINATKVSELSIRSGLTDVPVDINDGSLEISQENDLYRLTFTDNGDSLDPPANVFSATISTSYAFESKSNTFVLRNTAGQEVQMRLRVKPELTR